MWIVIILAEINFSIKLQLTQICNLLRAHVPQEGVVDCLVIMEVAGSCYCQLSVSSHADEHLIFLWPTIAIKTCVG